MVGHTHEESFCSLLGMMSVDMLSIWSEKFEILMRDKCQLIANYMFGWNFMKNLFIGFEIWHFCLEFVGYIFHEGLWQFRLMKICQYFVENVLFSTIFSYFTDENFAKYLIVNPKFRIVRCEKALVILLKKRKGQNNSFTSTALRLWDGCEHLLIKKTEISDSSIIYCHSFFFYYMEGTYI